MRQPLSQRIKARSGPGGILLMQPEFIDEVASGAAKFYTVLHYVSAMNDEKFYCHTLPDLLLIRQLQALGLKPSAPYFCAHSAAG